MKNTTEEEPKIYFERNITVVLILIAFAVGLDYLSYYILSQPSPWGIFVAIPGLIFTMQGLWLIVNPYAVVYENRFEIKQSFFYNKQIYYLDAKLIELKGNKFILTYNDLDKETLPLLGLRASHKQAMFDLLNKNIATSNLNRDF